MMNKLLMCDPPSGWRYGFPKAMPKAFSTTKEFNDWLVTNGYPKSEIDYWENEVPCRVWEQELNDGNKTPFSERT